MTSWTEGYVADIVYTHGFYRELTPNILNFVAPMLEKGTGALKINWEDELVKGTLVTKDGSIVHPQLAG